ncbi:efflux RND transporter permease subunit [Pelotomaculum isophthalicicum JI]|uniref:Efflux RND transporter permease subunit n=1 Tax=Pelotomaculum isophthalicicum JI TaxID=947010 RepID=A0A9X4JW15_9FIRM|nr:efflux RND transporter permease subunit [Pelotomaculum isophthalicicum]MDF9408412.1 efflux RND transporter permease subunit [Pelotomaculum isophthalicicum JI]
MYITNLSLKRPVLATVTILALITLGIISYIGLNINDYPEVEFPYVGVTVIQGGASPEQVETKIGLKLEEALGQIAGVKHIYTMAQEGVCTTYAEFTLDTSPDVAAQDVRNKMSSIRGELPTDIEEPVITKFDPTAYPIFSLAVYGDISLREMTTIVDDLIKKRIETINGVGSLKIYGKQEREIQIQLDKNKLAAYGLTTPEVLQSLSAENLNVPGGKVKKGDLQLTIRTTGQLSSVADFANLPVARREGVQLYVKDIATVVDGTKESENISRYQGNPAIGLDIIKQSGSNTVEVAEKVTTAIEELKKELPAGVHLDVVRDNSGYIKDGVRNVENTLVEGSLLAAIMVFIFLRDWRSTLITAIVIPSSVITTFFAMRILGFSLNFMSLMALSLSVGLLIDDAIVVIENIVRHMKSGEKPLAAAMNATTEIGLAVTSTTLTVVAVFMPVGFMSGIVGQYFKQFGITVVCAVLVSLLLAFTLVPLLSSRYLKSEEPKPKWPLQKFLHWFNRGFDRLTGIYAGFLTTVLKNRLITITIAILLFIGSLSLSQMLGFTFMPESDVGELTVSADLDAGLNLEAASKIAEKMEGMVKGYPETLSTYTTVTPGQVNLFVKLTSRELRNRTINQIASEMRRDFNVLAGVRTSIVLQGGMSSEKTVQFRLLGDNLDELYVYAEKAQRIMEGIPGAVDVSMSYKPGTPEGKLLIKRDQATDLGVSTAQVADTLRTLFNGVVVGQYEEGEDRFNVRVLLGEKQRSNLNDLNNIYLSSRNAASGTGSTQMIALNQVTDTVFSTAPSEISRFDRKKEIVLSANLDGTSLGNFNNAFMAKAKQELQMPPGYSFFASGQAEMMGDTFTNMVLALITAVLFIFFILAAQFESYIDPFSIMLSIPLAIIGAIFGLLVAGSELSIMSMIGIIMLMGLVTKNAILLIDFTKQQRANGVERNEALRRAAQIRLRPIMMTSMAMIVSMIPLALGLGSGAEGRAPMAHAIIGGLITSTLLTLVVVPVIYTLLDDMKKKFTFRNRRSAPTPIMESTSKDS